MKIFIEHRGSARHPWICLLAETFDEKRKLEELYWDSLSVDDSYYMDNNIEWQQNNFKLMFTLRVDQELAV